MRNFRHRVLTLAWLALMFAAAPACDSPSAPPIEQEEKDKEDPKDGIRAQGNVTP